MPQPVPQVQTSSDSPIPHPEIADDRMVMLTVSANAAHPLTKLQLDKLIDVFKRGGDGYTYTIALEKVHQQAGP